MTIVAIDTAKRAVGGREEVDAGLPAEQRGERLDELDLEDEAVDRRPEGEDEPPAGRREDEADAAALEAEGRADDRAERHAAVGDRAVERERRPDEEHRDSAERAADDGAGDAVEDARLPDVVAARSGHRGDQAGVGDGHERHADRGDDDRGDRRPIGHVAEDRQAVEHAEGDEVHGHERVGKRVEAGPALDEARRVPQEQRRGFGHLSCGHRVSIPSLFLTRRQPLISR